MNAKIRVKKFIEREWDGKSPLLLGYSGGSDSKSLLYALLDSPAAPFLHLAHVDHGWREESGEEALLLADEAARLNLPFHTTLLSEKPAANLEETGRIARLSFFRSLFAKIPFQALLLAHHADDVAETTLKRLLEGAHLQNVGGMSEVSILEGMVIWRPLLKIKKSDLTTSGFKDPTNSDLTFLRSRLRLEILPTLSKQFGKEVSANLSLLSERGAELKRYLDRKIASIEVLEGPWGKAVYLEKVERVEARHLLLQWTSLSRDSLESLLDNLPEFNLHFPPLIVDRGWVFLPAPLLPQFGPPIPLTHGSFTSGDWEIEVEEDTTPIPLLDPLLDWKDLWKGKFTLALSDAVLKMNLKFSSEEYRVAKVPSFLRPHLPHCDEKILFKKHPFPRWRVRFFVRAKCLTSVT